MFLKAPHVLQEIFWLSISVFGAIASIMFVDAIAGVWLSASGSSRNMVTGIVIIGIGSILFYLALGSSASKVIFAPNPRKPSVLELVFSMLGVPRLAVQPSGLQLSNILEWVGGGILHGGIMGGAIISVFGWAPLYLSHVAGWLQKEPWLSRFEVAPVAPFVVGAFLLGGTLKIAAGRGLAARSADLGYKFERPDILYLRPFDVDTRALSSKGYPWLNLFFPRRDKTKTIELILLNSISPGVTVSAVGQPEGEVVLLGAARTFSSRVSWQEMVQKGIMTARAVVLIADDSHGIAWEISQVIEKHAQSKTALVFQPKTKNTDSIRVIEEVFGVQVPAQEKPILAHATAKGVRVVMGHNFSENEYSAALRLFLDDASK
jgi:hypothetical protein